MHYVYILRSLEHPDQFYHRPVTGHWCLAEGAQRRPLAAHLQISALAADIVSRFWATWNRRAFERYLKSGSGRAFANKRLRW